MSRFRFLRKAFLALLLSLCAFLSLIVATSQIGQHVFRRRAERLLAEIQGLELRKTPWPEALRQFKHWGNAEELGNVCNDHECSFEIRLFEPVLAFISRFYFFVHLDDYLRWKLNLNYQM